MIELSTSPKESQLAYPGSRYEVLEPGPEPSLPSGHGGIAVHTWSPDSAGASAPPMVGVDGKPATCGFGRALVVVPAGERLIEVQDGRPQETTLVTIAEGQIVEFEYPPVKRKARRRPQGRTGLLDGLEERTGPYVAWGGLLLGGIGLIGSLVVAGVMVWRGIPAVALLAAVVGGLTAFAGYSTWKARLRPKRKKGKR